MSAPRAANRAVPRASLAIDVWPATPGCLPDADTDVLVWEEGQAQAQLGALLSTDPLEWIDAQGQSLRVVAWAELPLLNP